MALPVRLSLPLRDVAGGQYYGTAFLARPGVLRIRLIVDRAGAAGDILLGWTLPSAQGGGAGPDGQPLRPWTDRLTLAGLGVIDVAGAISVWILARRRRIPTTGVPSVPALRDS